MSEYAGPLTVELLHDRDSGQIVRTLIAIHDGAEIFASSAVRELMRHENFQRGMRICDSVVSSDKASPLRVIQMRILGAELARRLPSPQLDNINPWMMEAGQALDELDLAADGVRRTKVMWHYNSALICRLQGDFEGEAAHHRAILEIAEDEFSLYNAGYMAEFAMMLHYAKIGSFIEDRWLNFILTSNRYSHTLDNRIASEAQWSAHIWTHTIQLGIFFAQHPYLLNHEFESLARLISIGVNQEAEYTGTMVIAMGQRNRSMAMHLANYVANDERAGGWRIVAALYKAQMTKKTADYQAVLAMPGGGISHVARAVAKRALPIA